jgi:hypothetical protein
VRWIIHQPSSCRTLLPPGTAALRFGCGSAAPRLCIILFDRVAKLYAANNF